jgi:hypothetical protein
MHTSVSEIRCCSDGYLSRGPKDFAHWHSRHDKKLELRFGHMSLEDWSACVCACIGTRFTMTMWGSETVLLPTMRSLQHSSLCTEVSILLCQLAFHCSFYGFERPNCTHIYRFYLLLVKVCATNYKQAHANFGLMRFSSHWGRHSLGYFDQIIKIGFVSSLERYIRADVQTISRTHLTTFNYTNFLPRFPELRLVNINSLAPSNEGKIAAPTTY